MAMARGCSNGCAAVLGGIRNLFVDVMVNNQTRRTFTRATELLLNAREATKRGCDASGALQPGTKCGLNSAFPKHRGNVGDGVEVQAGGWWALRRLCYELPLFLAGMLRYLPETLNPK